MNDSKEFTNESLFTAISKYTILKKPVDNIPPDMINKLDSQVSKYYKLRDLIKTSKVNIIRNLPTAEHEKSLYQLLLK